MREQRCSERCSWPFMSTCMTEPERNYQRRTPLLEDGHLKMYQAARMTNVARRWCGMRKQQRRHRSSMTVIIGFIAAHTRARWERDRTAASLKMSVNSLQDDGTESRDDEDRACMVDLAPCRLRFWNERGTFVPVCVRNNIRDNNHQSMSSS